jgi:membrane protein DedA with SNARE-associated domain
MGGSLSFQKMNAESFMQLVPRIGPLAMVVAGIIGGEGVIIGLVLISSLGLLPLWWIIVFVTLGELISDVIYFVLGKLRVLRRFGTMKRLKKLYDRADSMIMKVSRESIFITLLYSKFIYGTRIFTLVYLGSKGNGWLKFILAELIVLVPWMSITIAIAWIFGKGVNHLSGMFQKIEVTVALFVLAIVVVMLVKKWVESRIIASENRGG